MAYEFVETLTLQLPDVETQLSDFSESSFKESHGLVIEIAAIHAGLTANYNAYSEETLEKSLMSWTTPYDKPIILNHDLYTEPLGRIIGARMSKEADGSPFVKLQAAITDPMAVQKVTDRRYLTGSVGGRAGEAICSVCDTNWAAAEGSGVPCRHQRGKVYNGKLAFMDMKDVQFHEYSFVNVPADKRSKVLATASESLTSKAKFFVLDMDSEGIIEYRESESPRDVLAEMKKKDATPLYMNLKGAYLAALSEEDSELNGVNSHIDHTNSDERSKTPEETVMAEEALVAEEEDDILAVSEGLSEDLSKITDEEAAATEEEGPEDEGSEDDEETDATEEADATEEVAAEESTEATEEEEAERPEAQEKPKDADVDAETSDGAPVSRESEDDEVTEEAAEEGAAEEQAPDTELSEESDNTDTEPLVEELKSEVATLKEENARLRKALHKTLVERVVDAKISAGVVEYEARAEAIEEHSKRSASSLADAYKDFAKLAGRAVSTETASLTMDDKSQVVADEKNAITIEDEDASDRKQADPMATAESVFVDALMGRRSLQF